MTTVLAAKTFRTPPGPFDEILIQSVQAELAVAGIARLTGFPGDVAAFVDFLSMFGEPLCYYGDSKGTHPDHPAVWKIKYEPNDAANGDVHAVAGPLIPHSSQALRSPRPPFFAMLMVNHGWQDLPIGHNGESLVVAWREAIQLLNSTPAGAGIVAELHQPIPFPDGISRPVAYTLEAATNPADIGIRLKSDLLSFLTEHLPGQPATDAVRQLTHVATQTARRIRLASGDVLIVDNDRWGHGRESVAGTRLGPRGETLLNPRELWSATVG